MAKLKVQVERLISDAESEKETRRRANIRIDNRFDKLEEDFKLDFKEFREGFTRELQLHARMIYIGIGMMIAAEFALKLVFK